MWEDVKIWFAVVAILFGAAIIAGVLGFSKIADLLAIISAYLLLLGLRLAGLAVLGVLFVLVAWLVHTFVVLPARQIKKYKIVRWDLSKDHAEALHRSSMGKTL
jgi:hypothetical protein